MAKKNRDQLANKTQNSKEDMLEFVNFLINDSKREYGNDFTDNISDGYHTFSELYDHRTILFSVIADFYHDRAWKSKKHEDGTMYDGMFVVGVETPKGQATYHVEDKYWNSFPVKELEYAPPYDGHTPKDVLDRLLSLCLFEHT